MDTKTLLDLIANQGFPITLSILLIFRIDRFMQEIVTAQKKGYRQILENTKEIHNTITTLFIPSIIFFSLYFTCYKDLSFSQLITSFLKTLKSSNFSNKY